MQARKTGPLDADMSFTSGAVKRGSQGTAFTPLLKYRLFFILIAVCTQPMRWSGAIWSRLERIREHTGSNLFKFVLRGLGFPFFQINQLLFKSIVFIQQFVILRLNARNRSLERDDRRL